MGGAYELAFQIDVTLTDVATWVAIVATILGGFRILLRFALSPLGAHLRSQDDKLDKLQTDVTATKELAQDAKHESGRVREELRTHMHWEERPWYQRLGRQPTGEQP